jgi:hypothetical protein
VRDATFVLDQLEVLNYADPHGILTGRLDLERRGMFGVSLGGMITAEACRIDPRLRAGIVMDVWMPEDVVSAGLRQPMMWLSRPATTMRLEGWDEVEVDATQASMRAVLETLPGDGFVVLVPGMFHIDFSDARLLSPLIASRGVCGPIDGERARAILSAYVVAFFDQELKGLPTGVVEGLGARFPEVLLESRGAIPA